MKKQTEVTWSAIKSNLADILISGAILTSAVGFLALGLNNSAQYNLVSAFIDDKCEIGNLNTRAFVNDYKKNSAFERMTTSGIYSAAYQCLDNLERGSQ